MLGCSFQALYALQNRNLGYSYFDRSSAQGRVEEHYVEKGYTFV